MLKVRSSSSGYLIGVVMAVIAILVTLVAALQYQGMARKRGAVVMEAKYQAERSADNLLNDLWSSLIGVRPSGTEEMFFADGTITSHTTGPSFDGDVDRNIVFLEADVRDQSARNYAGNLWGDPSFMNVGSAPNARRTDTLRDRLRTIPSQSLRVEGQPRSWNPQYDLYKRTRFKSVFQAGFPYAAFAPGPNGGVELEKVSTWNQAVYSQFDDTSHDPLRYGSGLKPLVGAGGDVKVQDFAYGEAHSREGKLTVKGGAAGFVGYLPHEYWGKKSYFKYLQQSIGVVRAGLDKVATDKTGTIFGKLNLPETMSLIANGSTPKNFLTYQAAAEWWFFMIPSVRPFGPTLEIRLHVPLPADTQAVGDAGSVAAKFAQIKALEKTVKELQNKLLPEAVDRDQKKWTKDTPGLLPKLHLQAKAYRKLEAEREQLEAEYRELESSFADQDELDQKQREIDKKNRELAKKREEIEQIDREVRRAEDDIELNKRLIGDLQKRLQEVVSNWEEGDPKGPNLTMQQLMSSLPVGKLPNLKSRSRYGPKKANQQVKTKNDPTKLLSRKGMLFHSYAAVLVRLAAQFRSILEHAMNTFPMRTIRIPLIFWETKEIQVPDHTRTGEWLQGIGDKLVVGLKNMVVYEVPLVFLKGKVLKPISNDNFSIPTTFNVPTGRTFKVQSSMTIQGDLWLQKGSSMIVGGNLKLLPGGYLTGGARYTEMLLPTGRIWMEEGSSLIVQGDLEALGDRYLGSIAVCGPAGVNHGLTSTVICDGRVLLPHGTGGGLSFEDFMQWTIGGDAGKLAKDFLEETAPNLCKLPRVFGAFRARTPYFGRYPLTFRVFPPKPVPIPTFEPTGQNANVNLLLLLSEIFEKQLNLTLGENFYTTCLWWGLRSQQVAVVPKLVTSSAKSEMTKGAKNLLPLVEWSGAFNIPSKVEWVVKKSTDLVSDHKLIAKTLTVVLVDALNPDPTGASQPLVDKALDEVLGPDSVGTVADVLLADLNPTIRVPGGLEPDPFKPMKNALKELRDAVNGLSPASGLTVDKQQKRKSAMALIVECPGVFVYGHRSIQLGPSNWNETPSARALGCFASEGDVTANVRYLIGSVISGDGRIKARELYYTPYFTRSSVYQPKELKKGGTNVSANYEYWENAVNMAYGQKLDSQTALDIPNSPVYFQAAQGWGP